MSKMTRAWIEAQIERELERGNSPDAVRDLAALIEVRKYMMEQGEVDAYREPAPIEHVKDHPHDRTEKHMAYDSMLNTIPTMDQVEKAMGAVSVNSDADRKRMHDAITWAKILKGEG